MNNNFDMFGDLSDDAFLAGLVGNRTSNDPFPSSNDNILSGIQSSNNDVFSDSQSSNDNIFSGNQSFDDSIFSGDQSSGDKFFSDSNTLFDFDPASNNPVVNDADNTLGNSFDSGFFSGDNFFDDLPTHVSVEPTSQSVEHQGGTQFSTIFSSPPHQHSNNLPAMTIDLNLDLLEPTIATNAPPSTPPRGPVESMWSEAYYDNPANNHQKSDEETHASLMEELGYAPASFTFNNETSSPAANMGHQDPTLNIAGSTSPSPKRKAAAPKAKTKTLPKPRAPRKTKAAAIPKAAPTPRVTKTKPKAATHARTTSAPRERTVQELYNVPFFSLSHVEKASLMLPLLQGIDPNTGLKVGVAGSLMQPPADYESIGADMKGIGMGGLGGYGGGKGGGMEIGAEYGAARQREALARGPRR